MKARGQVSRETFIVTSLGQRKESLANFEKVGHL